MALARLARLSRQAKRPYGLCVKMTAVAVLGLCFVFVWSMFSSPANSVTTQRESFDDIAEPVSSSSKVSESTFQSSVKPKEHEVSRQRDEKLDLESDLHQKGEKKVNGSVASGHNVHKRESRKRSDRNKQVSNVKKDRDGVKELKVETGENDGKENVEEEEGDQVMVDGKEEESESENDVNADADGDLVQVVDEEAVVEKVEDDSGSKGKTRKFKGPVFDPKAHYSWKLCNTRSKHNYIPCIDIEGGKLQSYRHRERSCPRATPMCLVPLPHGGYETPVPWPESKLKVYARVKLVFREVELLSSDKFCLCYMFLMMWLCLIVFCRYGLRMWLIQSLLPTLRNIVGWWSMVSISLFHRISPNSRVEFFISLTPLKR